MYSFYDLMGNGGTNNPGFNALPDYVQHQILANMANGGNAPKKKYKESNFSGNAWYQEGGEDGSQEEQIMQIIQMYAQLTEMEPQAILEELQGMEEEEQQQALQSMVQQIQSAQGQQEQGSNEEQGEVGQDDEEGEYMRRGGQPCYSCGGAMKYQTGGYIPEYGEMAYGGAPQNYSAKQTKKFNFAMGGPAVGQEMEVTAKELESLRKQGYQFQII